MPLEKILACVLGLSLTSVLFIEVGYRAKKLQFPCKWEDSLGPFDFFGVEECRVGIRIKRQV